MEARVGQEARKKAGSKGYKSTAQGPTVLCCRKHSVQKRKREKQMKERNKGSSKGIQQGLRLGVPGVAEEIQIELTILVRKYSI